MPRPDDASAPTTTAPTTTVLWTAATTRPLDEVATLVALLKDGEGKPGLGDEALRAAAVSRPVDEIRDLVTLLNAPPSDGDDAETTLRAAAVGRPIEDVAHLVHLLGSPEDTTPDADNSAPGSRRSALDRMRTARAVRGERSSTAEPEERSDPAAEYGEGSDGDAVAGEGRATAPVDVPEGAPGKGSATGSAESRTRVEGQGRTEEQGQARTRTEGRGRLGAAALRAPLRWPAAAALLLLGLIHLPRDFDGLRSGDYTDGASCAAAAVCVAVAVLLAVQDTLWAWIAGGATALGVIVLHALASALHTRDVLGHSLGGAVGGAGAATLVCAALVGALTATALLYRPPAAQVARTDDRA